MKKYITKPNSLAAMIALSLLAATTLISPQAAERDANRGQLSPSDYNFLTTAVQGDQMEVDLGNLAQQRSSNPQVQQFAQRMVQDHSQANDQLRSILAKNGAAVPENADSKGQKEVDKLKSLSGKPFDKEYMDMMLQDHKKDLKEFDRASHNVENLDLRAFAAKNASVIQGHLDMAENIDHQLKVNENH